MKYMHWFLNPVKEHYHDFEGRAGVKEYWMFILVYVLLSIALSIVEMIVGLDSEILTTLFALIVLIPSIALAARRLHDINKSGWWQLLALIPIVGWIILIVWLATKSDAGPNNYGAAPTAVPVSPDTPPIPEASKEEPNMPSEEESSDSEENNEEKPQ